MSISGLSPINYSQFEDLRKEEEVGIRLKKAVGFGILFGAATCIFRYVQKIPRTQLGLNSYYCTPAIGILVGAEVIRLCAERIYAYVLISLGDNEQNLQWSEATLKGKLLFCSWQALTLGECISGCVIDKIDRASSCVLFIRTCSEIKTRHLDISDLSRLEFGRYVLGKIIVEVVKVHIPREMILLALSALVVPPLFGTFMITGALAVTQTVMLCLNEQIETSHCFVELQTGNGFIGSNEVIRSNALQIVTDAHFVQKFINPFDNLSKDARLIFEKLPKILNTDTGDFEVDMGSKEFRLLFSYLQVSKKISANYDCSHDFAFLNNLLDGNFEANVSYNLNNWLRINRDKNDKIIGNEDFVEEFVYSLFGNKKGYLSTEPSVFFQPSPEIIEKRKFVQSVQKKLDDMRFMDTAFFLDEKPSLPTREFCEFLNKLMFSRKIISQYEVFLNQSQHDDQLETINRMRQEITNFEKLHNISNNNSDADSGEDDVALSLYDALGSFINAPNSSYSLDKLVTALDNQSNALGTK